VTASIDANVWIDSYGAVTIAASPDMLVALGNALTTDGVIELPPSTPVPPYEAAAKAIIIRVENEPGLSVSVEGDHLVVSGHFGALTILAGNVAKLGSEPPEFGNHMHIEWHADHFYLRADSTPLTVEVKP
jgi:hypothetical protein